MLLWEIFDTELDIEWKKSGIFDLGPFVWDDKKYIIQIENKQLDFPELIKKRTAEISFFRSDKEGEVAFSTSNDTSFPIRVYGVVANALTKKVSNYDAFYFSAEKRHSKNEKEFKIKTDVYDLISDRIAKNVGMKLYIHLDADKNRYLISRIKIKSDKFKNPLKEALKDIGIEWEE